MDITQNIIGREKETAEFEKYVKSGKPEFIAVYGRRRVGKTFLINQLFNGRMAFSMTGVLEGNFDEEIDAFLDAMDLYGLEIKERPATWMRAFTLLRKALQPIVDTGADCIVFFDEIPCLDTHGSGFAKALGHFWNSWASLYNNMKLIVCGSATTWMIKNIIDSHGGLHDRITHEIKLLPFTLKETEQYLINQGFHWSRLSIVQSYMMFGGVAYYLSLLDASLSLTQNIDKLYFDVNGPLRREYKRLFKTLFRLPEPYLEIVELLARHKKGLTRAELMQKLNKDSGGNLSDQLENLLECGLVRKYKVREKNIVKGKGSIYQLMDMFSLFHTHFADKLGSDSRYWANHLGTPEMNTWLGLAYERVCLLHTDQIKETLHIDTIASEQYSWRSKESTPAAQIDLIIDRADDVVNVCEIKYSNKEYSLSEEESKKMAYRLETFRRETGTRQSLYLTLITASPLAENAHSNDIPVKLTMDALFL
jgi:hypothetical protein